MRIYHLASRRPAKPIKGKNDTVPVYKCFPPGSGKNRDENAVKFEKIADAADYLRRVSGAGIRVATIGEATGQRTAILNTGLAIEHDDGRIELL